MKNMKITLALAVLCFHPRPAGAESLTLTTYYPAPYGGYVSLLTTGDTFLSRDVSGSLVTVGKTGGTADKLLVNGNIKATNNIFGVNVFADGNPVVTKVVCDPPLICTITNNTLHISIGAAPCNAPEPACGQTTHGVDGFGVACTKTKEACQYKCPSIENTSSDPTLCPKNNSGASTCQGQTQFAATCYWIHRWAKLTGCKQTTNTENCVKIN